MLLANSTVFNRLRGGGSFLPPRICALGSILRPPSTLSPLLPFPSLLMLLPRVSTRLCLLHRPLTLGSLFFRKVAVVLTHPIRTCLARNDRDIKSRLSGTRSFGESHASCIMHMSCEDRPPPRSSEDVMGVKGLTSCNPISDSSDPSHSPKLETGIAVVNTFERI